MKIIPISKASFGPVEQINWIQESKANSYHPPFMPHELDVHPDGRRIQATLDEYESRLEEKTTQKIDDRTADLERQLEEAENELDQLKAKIRELL